MASIESEEHVSQLAMILCQYLISNNEFRTEFDPQ